MNDPQPGGHANEIPGLGALAGAGDAGSFSTALVAFISVKQTKPFQRLLLGPSAALLPPRPIARPDLGIPGVEGGSAASCVCNWRKPDGSACVMPKALCVVRTLRGNRIGPSGTDAQAGWNEAWPSGWDLIAAAGTQEHARCLEGCFCPSFSVWCIFFLSFEMRGWFGGFLFFAKFHPAQKTHTLQTRLFAA